MSPRPGGIPERLPCGHLAALSYVSVPDWTAWCMVCEQRMNLPPNSPRRDHDDAA